MTTMTAVKPSAPALPEPYMRGWANVLLGADVDVRVHCWEPAAAVIVGRYVDSSSVTAGARVSHEDVAEIADALRDLLLVDLEPGLATSEEPIRTVELAGGAQLRMELSFFTWTEDETEEEDGEIVVVDTCEMREAENVIFTLTESPRTDQRSMTATADLAAARNFALVLAGVAAAHARKTAGQAGQEQR